MRGGLRCLRVLSLPWNRNCFPILLTVWNTIYIDYLQNARSKTIASVYSVRPVPKAQVSFPVSWGQLEKEQVHPAHYHLRNVPALLKTQGDLFSQVLIQRQNLEQILTAVK